MLCGGVELWVVLLLFVVSVGTAMVSTATGMGGGVLLFAVILRFFPLKATVPIHGFVQMFANVIRTVVLRRHLLWRMCLPFVVGALLGILSIWWLLDRIKSELVPSCIILTLIVYALFKPKRLPALNIPFSAFGLVGYATGFLGILIGAVDPILSPFFIREDLSKQEVVANKSLMQSVVHLSKLPVFLSVGFNYGEVSGVLLVLVVGSVIGTVIGVSVLERISRKLFVWVFKLILAAIGIQLAVRVVRLWMAS